MKAPGLESQRWIDPVDDFVRRRGRSPCRWAIACTYEIDLALVQRVVLPVLSRRGSAFRTVVLADGARLEAALAQVSRPFSGAINLHSVRMRRGVFHPKLLLLRAGDHARVCFGSANLTSSGISGNLELWTYSDDPEIVAAIVEFLNRLVATPTIQLDGAGRRSVDAALLGLSSRAHPAVWSSLDESFRKRLLRDRGRKARRAIVVSPMYASAAGLTSARTAIPATRIDLFTDQPVKTERGTTYVLGSPASTDDDEEETGTTNDRGPTTLHAKAYVFPRGEKSPADTWMGSANYTAQALAKDVGAGGNVELMVRTELPVDELARLEADLERWFSPVADTMMEPPIPSEPIPTPLATVMSCELFEGKSGPVMVVYSSRRKETVELVFEGRHIEVAITRGRGLVDGKTLARFMPSPDLSAATPIIVHQRIGNRLQPIIVNVPHVPPTVEEGGAAFNGMEAMIADMIGRVQTHVVPETPNQLADDYDEDPDSEPEPPPEELERRLDEVRHQGDLDRIAVSLAVLLRLVARTPIGERRVRRYEALKVVLASSPAHLHPLVKAHFAKEKER
jgi:hypothetical protein